MLTKKDKINLNMTNKLMICRFIDKRKGKNEPVI